MLCKADISTLYVALCKINHLQHNKDFIGEINRTFFSLKECTSSAALTALSPEEDEKTTALQHSKLRKK